MLARTVCETALTRAMFARSSNFFLDFFGILVQIWPNLAHLLGQIFSFKKIILNIYAIFMADDEISLIAMPILLDNP